ncbi:MAG: sensor histidine kinase [Candidatus Cyclobacteriaceae bacterium M2_1C_046]
MQRIIFYRVDIPNETTLTAAERTFRDIFNYSSDLIYIHDENGVFIDVNQTVLDKYGYPKEEIIGKTPGIFGVPGKNDIPAVMQMIKIAWEEDIPQRFEWWSLKKDGEEFLKEIVIRKGRYFDRDVLIATGRDITDRQRAEMQLKKQNQELKQLNTALDAFVYSASHDLKAPLSSMKGLLDLMKKDDPARIKEYISKLKESVNRLNQFVSDLIDYSRNAKTGVEFQKIKINDSIKQIVNQLKYAEEAENIVFDLQTNAPKEIKSDPFRIRTILSNLISNSIRYHDNQKKNKYIIIRSSVEKNHLILEVIDNGIGIASEHQDKIFKMFYRSKEKDISGSGLGLFMVKEAVDLLEGTIAINSTPGNGTKIKVSLPLIR